MAILQLAVTLKLAQSDSLPDNACCAWNAVEAYLWMQQCSILLSVNLKSTSHHNWQNNNYVMAADRDLGFEFKHVHRVNVVNGSEVVAD